MSRLHKFLTVLIAFAAAASAVAAFFYFKQKKELDELDAYLEGEEDLDTIPYAAEPEVEEDLIDEGIIEPGQEAEFAYRVDAQDAAAFAADLAAAGLSSSYDPQCEIIDVTVCAATQDDLDTLLHEIAQQAVDHHAEYLGFALV
jgi:hypothetical protein